MVFARDGTAHILDFEMGCQAAWFSPEMAQPIFWILDMGYEAVWFSPEMVQSMFWIWDVKLYGFRPRWHSPYFGF